MGVHYGNRPTGNAPASKLLNDYGGAAAAYSLRLLDLNNASNPVVRARRASDNAEKDFTANEVDRGELLNWTQGLPSPGSYDASRDVGYFGEVSSSDLISGDDLATELNLTAGTSQNSDAGWLKFYVGPNAFCNRQGNAYILYVAKRTMRYGLSWNDINSAGGVDGTTEVEIDGQSYSVRLMQGADADPSTFSFEANCSQNAGGNSEWNELFYRVSEKIPDCADPTEGMGANSTIRHGGPQNGSNWANFTNSELNVNTGNGRAAWCQEVVGPDPSRRVDRGSYGVASWAAGIANREDTRYGWRPCLQINLGQSGDVSAFVTTWYDQSGNDNHATQTTATNQPKIVDAGTLVTENGKAAIDFDGVDDALFTSGYVVELSQNDASVFAVRSVSSVSDGRYMITEGDTVSSYSSNFIFGGTNGVEILWVNTVEIGIISEAQQDLLGFIYDGATFQAYLNGATSGSSESANVNTEVFNRTVIGASADIATAFFRGKIQEIIIYPSDQSNNRTAIESNINSYYDIY